MSRQITAKSLLAALAEGKIVPLTEKCWRELAAEFKEVANFSAGLGGVILLVQWPLPGGSMSGWALVEDPEPGQKVIRPLANEREARALIADRLAAYERMWDG